MTPDALARAVAVVRQGGVVAVPFEAQYGLAALALDPDAVRRVLDIKTRTSESPLPVVIPDERWLDDLVEDIPPMARDLMKRFWPGPLTLVLKARPGLPSGVASERGTVGVRIPGPCLAADLLACVGRPLTATSANVSGEKPALSPGDLNQSGLAARVDIVLEDKALKGLPSTVVEIVNGEVRVLRPGAISLDDPGRT